MAQRNFPLNTIKSKLPEINQTSIQLKEMLAQGITIHQQGYFNEAKAIYQKILRIQPNHFDALQLTGVIAAQTKNYAQADAFLSKAIKVNSFHSPTYLNLGLAKQELKQYEAAIASYDKAINLNPSFAEAFYNRGLAYQEIKQYEAAIASYDKAISINPSFAEAFYNRGLAYQEIKQYEAAIASYDKAISINPSFAEAFYNRGLTYQEIKQYEAAIASYDKAIDFNANNFNAYTNRGNAFKGLKQYQAAIADHNKAISLNPIFAYAHNNLGIVLQELKHYDEAIASYENAISLKSEFAEAFNNLANVYNDIKMHELAIENYDKAISYRTDFSEAYFNKGTALIKINLLDQAYFSFIHAYNLQPTVDYLLGTLIHTKMRLCEWSNLNSFISQLVEGILNNEKIAAPFIVLALLDDPEIHKQSAKISINDKWPANDLLAAIKKYPPHKKIRLGYFSADFREHPVSYLTAELFELHNREKFEVIAFSFGPDMQDDCRKRLENGFDQFLDVKDQSDDEIAALSRKMEVDIAIDLGGFTAECRTGIFAMRAAPIQLSYIGYLGTMGSDYYDYLIADSTIIPLDYQKYYSEKIVYLPSYQVNDTKREISEKLFTKSEVGLPDEGFVFCCFNNIYKITPKIFDSWMRILTAVEGSVLYLLDANETATNNLRKEANAKGVSSDRLIFGKVLPTPLYLARYRIADLFLDTLPYNAGTTASDALRIGLPVITQMGKSFASRMAASLLNAVGLPELVTTNQDDYESLAIMLATNPLKLETIRDKLINNLPKSPLYNTKLFTQHLESAYQIMYQRYQEDSDHDHIYEKAGQL